jgi:hypothetical protein
MNTIKYPKYSKVGVYELPFLITGIEENFSNLVQGIMTPGLLIKKLSSGVLSSDFLVSGNGPLNINAGYLTYNDNGKIRIVKFDATVLSVDAISYPNGNYYVCIKPKSTNYEKGTLSFTNGSDIVSSTIKNVFKYLRPGGSIIIENADSIYGNGGNYPIISTSVDSVRLATPFNGTSESGLKWKIGAEFPDGHNVDSNNERLAYEYDGYDLVISSSPVGYELCYLRMSSGVATILSDRRPNFLAVFKNNSGNADDILSGLSKDITTIEEKASAARLDRIVKNTFTKGIRTGLNALTIGEDLIRVEAGEAIDGNGKLILVPNNVTFNTADLFNESKIIEGDNYLHLYYVQPNTYAFYWSQTESSNPIHVSITKVTYSQGTLIQS